VHESAEGARALNRKLTAATPSVRWLPVFIVIWTGIAAVPLAWFAYGVSKVGFADPYSELGFLFLTCLLLFPSAELVTWCAYLLRSTLPKVSDHVVLRVIWVLSAIGNYVLFVAAPNLLRIIRARIREDDAAHRRTQPPKDARSAGVP
jgi:hypothetical protein